MDVTPIRANLQTVQGLCRAMALGLLGLIFLATAVAAQASFNFSRIDVEGNIRIDDSTVESFAGIAPGTPVSAGQLNAAYQRVIASGLFETVEILPAGRVLTIKVKEFPTINQVAIEGNQRLKDELLETLIQSQPRRVYSPTQAEADARAITEAYRQSGRLSATVTARIIPRSQNRVDVVYEVTEGRVVEVERIGFVGNRSYSERRLREVLGTKQAGFLRALINRDSFVEDRVAFDRQVLTDFYQSRGFIDFRVLSVGSEFSRERNAFFLVFNIQEGQRYRIGDISVRSDVPGLDAAPYFEILRKRSGQYYSPLRIEDGVSRIERQTLAEGRDFIRVTPELIRNERDQIVDVVYVMSRGPRIFVERIDIEGNEQTLDRVIRRQFDTVEGDPFNPREIRDAAERIRALGFFETAEVNASEGTSPDRVIIDVDVAEQPTGNIRLGLNYSVGDGASVAFGLSESNFLGRGQRLSFDINAGVDNASSRITLIDPALLGRD
ncbi:MAG: outer membrane protein assembly factor BamA, partial [Mangrovicoccus sp.]